MNPTISFRHAAFNSISGRKSYVYNIHINKNSDVVETFRTLHKQAKSNETEFGVHTLNGVLDLIWISNECLMNTEPITPLGQKQIELVWNGSEWDVDLTIHYRSFKHLTDVALEALKKQG